MFVVRPIFLDIRPDTADRRRDKRRPAKDQQLMKNCQEKKVLKASPRRLYACMNAPINKVTSEV